MVLRLAPVLLVVALAGCGNAGPLASPSPLAPVRIEVTLNDQMRILPTDMTARVGHPVTFVIANSGAIAHEFYLGDEAEQSEHEQEMLDSGGMMHDHSNGIGVEPGDTRELTFTFQEVGPMIAGCHIPGHYAAGMKADITLQ